MESSVIPVIVIVLLVMATMCVCVCVCVCVQVCTPLHAPTKLALYSFSENGMLRCHRLCHKIYVLSI